nr:late embryogenesis abundant protein, LEA-14 [Tanacetum cinerariifolium]
MNRGGVGTVGPSRTRPLGVVMALSSPFGLATFWESVATGGETLVIRMSSTASNANFLNGFYGSWRWGCLKLFENSRPGGGHRTCLLIDCMSGNGGERVNKLRGCDVSMSCSIRVGLGMLAGTVGKMYNNLKLCRGKETSIGTHGPLVLRTLSICPVGSRNSSASISAGRSIPAASRNRPASIHAVRHIPAGRFNKPAPFLAGRSVPTGWTNHAVDGCQVTQNWMVITFHVPFWNENWLVQGGTTLELDSPGKPATGKDVSNPFMAVMVCQKPLGYFNSPMIHVPRAGLVIHPPGLEDLSRTGPYTGVFLPADESDIT